MRNDTFGAKISGFSKHFADFGPNATPSKTVECSFLGGFGKWRYRLKYASNQGGVNKSPET